MYDLVQAVETIFSMLCCLHYAKMVHVSFMGITHISDKISIIC